VPRPARRQPPGAAVEAQGQGERIRRILGGGSGPEGGQDACGPLDAEGGRAKLKGRRQAQSRRVDQAAALCRL
jgi:hypothetical protein